jgi:hypothetical protein
MNDFARAGYGRNRAERQCSDIARRGKFHHPAKESRHA